MNMIGWDVWSGLKSSDGGETTFAYDNLNNILTKSEKVDSLNSVMTEYQYDKKYRLIKMIEDVGGLNITTERQYDILGRLTKIIDSKGNETAYEYDSENRITKETYADGGSILKEYDLKGRLTKRTDQKGDEISYEYDSRDLLIKKNYGLNGVQTFEYDNLLRLVLDSDNNKGELDIICEYEYDPCIVKSNNRPFLLLYNYDKSYDAFGHLISCVHPSG